MKRDATRVCASIGIVLPLLAACGGEAVEAVGRTESALTESQSRVLGFESPTVDWSKTSGTLAASTLCAEGTQALSISGIGYAELASNPLSSLGNVADTVSFKLLLPADQPNPWWYGQVSLVVEIPSLGISTTVGQTDLTGLPLDTFVPISYTWPSNVAAALRGTYTDLRFKVILNVPSSTNAYLLDGVDVGLTSASGSQTSDPAGPEQLSVSISIPEGVELDRAPLVASNVLRVNDGVEIVLSDPSRGATLTNTGSYTNIGVRAKVPSVRVAGTLVLRDWAKVQGHAWAGGTVDKAATASATDGYLAGAPVVTSTMTWERPFETSVVDIILEPHTTRPPLPPGHYRTISLKSYAQLELEPGTYQVDRLLLEPDSELAMPGPTRLWVRSELIYRGNVLAHPASFYLTYLGNTNVFIERRLSGTLLAPHAKVDLASLSYDSHRGSVIAKGIELHQHTRFLHVPYTGRGYLAYKAPTQVDLALESSTGFLSLGTARWSEAVGTIEQPLEAQTCPAEFSNWTADAEPQPDFSSLVDEMLIPQSPPTSPAEGTYADPHITTRDNPEFSGLLELEDGQTITECGVDGICHEFDDKRYDCDTRLDFYWGTYPSCDGMSCVRADSEEVELEINVSDALGVAGKAVPWSLRSGRLSQGQKLFAYGFKDLGGNFPTWEADPIAYHETPNLWTQLDPEVLVVPVVVVGVYLPWRGEDRYEVGLAHLFHGWRLFEYDNRPYGLPRDDDWWLPVDLDDLWDQAPRYDVVHPDDVYDKCKIQFRVIAGFEMAADQSQYDDYILKTYETLLPLGTKEQVIANIPPVYDAAAIVAMDPVFVLYGTLADKPGDPSEYAGKADPGSHVINADPNDSNWPLVTAHELTHIFYGNHGNANGDPANLFHGEPTRNATVRDAQCGFPVEQNGVVQLESGLRAAARPFAVRYSQYLYALGATTSLVPDAPNEAHLNPCCVLSEYEQRNVSPAMCLQAGGSSEERSCDGQRYCCASQSNPPGYAPICDSSQRLPLSECERDWQCCRLSQTEQLWAASSDCAAQGGSLVDGDQCRAFSYCCASTADSEVAGSFAPCSAVSRALTDCETVCCADANTAEFEERFNCLADPQKEELAADQCQLVCCDWTDPSRVSSEDSLYTCTHAGTKVGEAGDPLCHPAI